MMTAARHNRAFSKPKVIIKHMPGKAHRVGNDTFILNAWRHLSTRRLEAQLAAGAPNSDMIRKVLRLREERDRIRDQRIEETRQYMKGPE